MDLQKEQEQALEKTDEVLLSVRNLTTYYITREIGTCKAVNDVSFDIKSGETLGIVGETGAGKTSIAYSILRLLPIPPAKVMSGEILWNGEDLLQMSVAKMRKIRGKEISMVFQDPMTALNPIDPVGDQIAEVIYLHQKVSRAESKRLAAEMLEVVGIPRERFSEFPHQFSGGMKQRVVIAIALACNPKLLIADEPTTALDVTIQAQVLEMMNELKEKNGTSVMLITHDLGIIAEMCQRVAVIYAGQIIEIGSTIDIFDNTSHPYTVGLFESLPSVASGKRLVPIPGMMPDPSNLPEGCKFAERCRYATDACREQEIELEEVSPGHFCRCIRNTEVRRGK
jgi:peptide/nickel transport system ATP-binding protein